MEPIRIIHLADTHIGMENYGRLDPSTGLHTRLQDFIACLRFVVDTALEQDVDAVLFAGDAYRHATPSPTHEGAFAEQMKRLTERQIPVVMIPGNHDVASAFGKASSLSIFNTLGGKEYFRVIEKPDILKLETKRGRWQVACFPWPTRHALLTKDEYKNLSDDGITKTIEQKCENIIAKFARDLDPGTPSVLLAHVAAADAIYSGSERSTMIGREPVILQSLLKNPAFDYVALGHIHKHQDLHPNGQPHVVYCGSLERIDFGEASDQKGFCLVTLEKGASAYQFIPTPARKFIKIDIDVRHQGFPTEAILKRLDTYDFTDAIVRVTYLIDEAQKTQIDTRCIYGALSQAFLIAGVAHRTEDMQQRRPHIPEGLTLAHTLTEYLKYRTDLEERMKDDLQVYAGQLISEMESSE